LYTYTPPAAAAAAVVVNVANVADEVAHTDTKLEASSSAKQMRRSIEPAVTSLSSSSPGITKQFGDAGDDKATDSNTIKSKSAEGREPPRLLPAIAKTDKTRTASNDAHIDDDDAYAEVLTPRSPTARLLSMVQQRNSATSLRVSEVVIDVFDAFFSCVARHRNHRIQCHIRSHPSTMMAKVSL
jgi:hypothetical protein